MYCGVILCLIAAVQMTAGHSFHFGDCPSVRPMDNFDMEKFLGRWYVIQKTLAFTKHQVLTYSHGDVRGEYNVLENALRPIIGRTDYSGKLKPTQTPALMNVKFPLNPGSYDYIVFMTDYENYAGVFSCQKIIGTHRRAASILSRTPTLDQSFIDQVRERLDYFGANADDLLTVDQLKPAETGRSLPRVVDDDRQPAPVWDLDPRLAQPTESSNETDLHLF